MDKNRLTSVCLLLFLLFNAVCASSRSVDDPESCIVGTAKSYLHVREATGRNDGKEVEVFLASVGLPKGYSWCAAFVHYVLECCGIENSINAWSPTAHNSRDVVYSKGIKHKYVLPGDVFTIWSPSKGRIAHAGFVAKQVNARFYKTVEGNTNDGGSFNGDGVYSRIRSYKQTHSITRWR